MSSTAASGFLVFLLSVPVMQGQNWRVTYNPTETCVLKGSTVEISCTYRYPSRINVRDTAVEKTIWFTRVSDREPVDLRADSEYSGRVQNHCSKNSCTLTISDLRERDSAEYKFMFTTNQSGGSVAGEPGVTLSVTDPDLRVEVKPVVHQGYTKAELRCHSACRLPDHPSYIWYKKGQEIEAETASFTIYFEWSDSFSCALKGREDFPSPPVYGPKLPSVSVSPSAEIVEGSSVTLTCSSDANTAANYTWYKENQTLASPLHGPEDIYHFPSISSKDRGNCHCKSENQHGELSSKSVFIDVQYGPKRPSASVSPSAEIVEGSSVTLTCSSDANPAANYTWYKENEDSPKASGQIFTITDVRPEHSGDYSCEAQNRRGRQSSTLHLTVIAGKIYF
ncbi:sialoadhesin-like [Etheostoma cragini]|uniref:sialoadhesin-like n=1 Tax=Etheostoma cragini TaxID=417921 RepID=UPI00155E8BC9|nr:sialoadhesin-like [Etheostoma cragini]